MSLTKEERSLILQIAQRAAREGSLDVLDTILDLELTHSKVFRLDLKRFLLAPSADFLHDITGISNSLDRDGAKFTSLFLPRYAEVETWEEELKKCEALGMGPMLAKACVDDFEYALGLSCGTTLRFSHARIVNDNWISISAQPEDFKKAFGYPMPRGVEICIKNIVWVADAPYGS
jgi:hypothetical protein